MEWNYADIYEAIAAATPDAPCQVQGEQTITWSQFDRHTSALAHALVDAGLEPGAKVGILLHNRPEFIEAYVACFKARLTPVNINYRYGHDELVHVLGDSDAEAVIFQARYAGAIEGCRDELPLLRYFLAVEDGSSHPDWAQSYEAVTARTLPPPVGVVRSGNDSLLVYTGGTTGAPKGVIWRQHQAIRALGTAANFYIGKPPAVDIADVVARLDDTNKRLYVACPMMHATGLFTSLSLMSEGYAIETSAAERFDAAELWRTVAEHRANALVIVGDTFARPLLAELDARGADYDLSNLDFIISSGTKLSRSSRRALLKHLPHVLLSDNYGSSEALRGVATNSTRDTIPKDGVIAHSERLALMGEDGTLLDTGVPGTRGALLIRGHLADGYYKDPDKTAASFRTVDGIRFCVTGDFARIEPGGAVRLLGRGSSVINTGGEKVFPQEVEETIRTHPAVSDVAVVGLPDERFGQVVSAVVTLHRGGELALSELAAHVKDHLAGYKAPRHLFVIDAIPLTAAGKPDHKAARALALSMLVGQK